MKKILTLLLISWCAVTYAQNTIPVTFKVNMAVQVDESNFNAATDSVVIRGSFQTDASSDSSNWSGNTFLTTDENGDLIYNLTINFPDSTDGNTYQYKFVTRKNGTDGWESFSPDRSLEVTAPSMNLPIVYFNNDSVVTRYVTNILNFTADLSDIYGTGLGYFDPSTDSIRIQGLTWSSSCVVQSSETQRKMTEDPFSPAIYTTSLTIYGPVGDSCQWKTQAGPGDKFFNSGWEVENNRTYYVVPEDNATYDIPVFKPSVFPEKNPLSMDVSVLFQVDIANAVNRYNHSRIDLSTVQFVGLEGQNPRIGAWSGSWTPEDTSDVRVDTVAMWALNDSGILGDKIAGDNIWSRIVVFPTGNIGGPSLYQYGIYYSGVDTVNATEPMKNEFASGDHYINIYDNEELIEVLNVFGTYSPVISSVKQIDAELPASITLEQNYPNPFNPETTIRYAIPKSGMVELAIFNILGQKVAQLLNQEQTAGSYEVKFNASKFSSGIYFYRLSGSGMTQTKKMMLIK